MKDTFEGFCALLFGTLVGFFLGCFIAGPTDWTIVFAIIFMFISFGIREHYKNIISNMKWAVRSSKNIILYKRYKYDNRTKENPFSEKN